MNNDGDTCVNDISEHCFANSLNLDSDFILLSLAFIKIISVISALSLVFKKEKKILPMWLY